MCNIDPMRNPTNISGPDRHAVQVVLAIEPEAAGEWFNEPADSARGANRTAAARSIGLAVVDVLEGLPDMVMTTAREPLAAGESDSGVKPGSMAAYRTVFCLRTADGRPVDIELLDAMPIECETEPTNHSPTAGKSPSSSSFCELRLSCGFEESASAADSGPGSTAEQGADSARQSAANAVFAAARLLIDKLPAFPAFTDARACAAGEANGLEPVRAARVDLARARTPHEALIAIAENVARQWFGNERGARESDDVEFVHQMRVALRRAKTLLKTFPKWADDAWLAGVKPGLQWIGQMLGEARDLDVLVDSTLPALAAADADSSIWSGLIAEADARRSAARARLQQALRSRRYAQFSLAWLEWLTDQHFSQGPPEHAQRALRDYAAKRARRHFKRLTAEPPLSSLDAAGRHRRRIEAKRLRYTLEFFAPLVAPGRRRKLARQVGRIQSVLGEANDAAAALRFFDEQHLDVTDYQQGFARGWCEAANRAAAREAERLIGKLAKPKIVREA